MYAKFALSCYKEILSAHKVDTSNYEKEAKQSEGQAKETASSDDASKTQANTEKENVSSEQTNDVVIRDRKVSIPNDNGDVSAVKYDLCITAFFDANHSACSFQQNASLLRRSVVSSEIH